MAVIEPDGTCKDGPRWLFASMQQGEYSNYKPAMHFNHGKVWTSAERAKLVQAFRHGLNLHDLNTYMGRTNIALVKQLKDMKLIQLDTSCARYWSEVQLRHSAADRDIVLERMRQIHEGTPVEALTLPSTPAANPQPETKEITMSNEQTLGKIEQRIFVDNVPADTMSLDELLAKAGKLKDTVHKLEASASDFEKFGRVPAALKSRIAEHRKNLGALLDLIDTQFPDTTSD